MLTALNPSIRRRGAHGAVSPCCHVAIRQDMCGLCLPERQVAQDGWAQGSVGRGQQASPAYDQDALKRAPCPDPGAMFARVAHKQQEAFAAFPHRPAAPDISGVSLLLTTACTVICARVHVRVRVRVRVRSSRRPSASSVGCA